MRNYYSILQENKYPPPFELNRVKLIWKLSKKIPIAFVVLKCNNSVSANCIVRFKIKRKWKYFEKGEGLISLKYRNCCPTSIFKQQSA